MRKKLIYLSTIVASAMAVTGAQAATIMIEPSPPAGGFANDNVTCSPVTTTSCTFTDEGTFVTPAGFQLVSATISTISTSAMTNLDFSSVLLNNVAFTLSRTGSVDFGSLEMLPLTAGGTNRLVITGTGTPGGSGSYRGTLTFAQMAAVPEPSTWMLMLLGMAGVGFSMRRKEKQTLRVRYT